MPSPLTLGLFVLAAVAWPLSLARPGWTSEWRRSLSRHRWRWVAVLAGLLAVGAADPLIPRTSGLALAQGWASLSLPELGRRTLPPLLGAAVLALPVLADVRLRPGGLPSLGPAAGRFLLGGAGWAGIALAPLLTARGAAGAWTTTLGGDLHPRLHPIAGALLGVAAAPGAISVPHPALPAVLSLASAAGLLALTGVWATEPLPAGARLAWRRTGVRWGWGLLVGLAGLAVFSLAPHVANALSALAYWIAAGALVAVSRRRGVGGDWRHLAWGLALGGALLLAFRLRWGFLVETPGWALPLSMDAQSYFDEALYLDRLLLDRRTNLLALFYSGATYFREPLYIYLMHGWLKLVGPQEIHTVFLSVLASVAWIGASAVAVRLLLNRWAGLLTAFLLAVDAIWYRNAAVGLREEVTGTLLGLTIIALWAGWARRPGQGRPGWQESSWLVWVAPLLAGGAAITRLDALPLALFLLLWAAVAQRWAVWRAGLILAVFVAVVLPPLAGHARSRGDAAPASTEIATNNWREVFKDRLGEPGFEVDRRVSASEFLFRYFTPPQLVAYTARGYARIYGEEVFESHFYLLAGLSGAWGGAVGLHTPWLFPFLFLAGTGGILLQRQHWRRMWLVPAICVVGVLPPIGFVAGVPGHSELYQARYAYQVAPYATATVAWALVAGGIWMAGRVVRLSAVRSAVRPPREARSDLALRRGA